MFFGIHAAPPVGEEPLVVGVVKEEEEEGLEEEGCFLLWDIPDVPIVF